jgi:hypothetical protein
MLDHSVGTSATASLFDEVGAVWRIDWEGKEDEEIWGGEDVGTCSAPLSALLKTFLCFLAITGTGSAAEEGAAREAV